jgi:hypothetical protein
VIVVSRHRAAALRRCLAWRCNSRIIRRFEVIVVADPALDSKPPRAFRHALLVALDEANISAARNAGIWRRRPSSGAGWWPSSTDDAVAEPVVGANGFSFEWTAGTVDRTLTYGRLEVPQDRVSLHRGAPDCAIEIKGVNCAYRREVIAQLGGFDPNLAYYLDETELNLRLAATGAQIAVVPLARVHHAKAASAIRRSDRTPLSLWNIGASTALTLRRHASVAQLAEGEARMTRHEETKLAVLLKAGRITADDSARLAASLRTGFRDGLDRELAPLAPLGRSRGAFAQWPSPARQVRVFRGRSWQAVRLDREARAHVAAGGIARVIRLSPTSLFHRLRFLPEGYWLQTGGLFGKSLRSDPLWRFWQFSARCKREEDINRLGFWKS